MELYKWQRACLRAWSDNGYRGIVNVVTGAGKTVLALAAIDRLREKYPELRVRIVVPTIPLAGQWKRAMLEHARNEKELPGFYGGMRRDAADRDVMIYIVNSARTALARHLRAELALGRHVLLICDECHHYQSPENRRIFSFLTPAVRKGTLYACLGLSATPFSDEQGAAYLRQQLGEEIYRYGFEQAERDGVIAPFFVCRIGVGFLGEERKKYAELSERIRSALQRLYRMYPELKELPEKRFLNRVSAIAAQSNYSPEDPAALFLLLCYQRKEISVLARARVVCCTELIARVRRMDRIIVFCERIDQTECVVEALRLRFGAGVCGVYHSKMTREARERNMGAFRNGSVRILVSCRCLDEGIDVPDADIGIVLSSSSTARQRIQRLGRVIRRSAGKDAACLYYIYIRESTDNRAYLPGFQDHKSFDMQFFPEERDFSNDLYEYAAIDLMERAENSGMPERQLAELRRCLLEGLTRADCLLSEDVLRINASDGTVRERNYWKTMGRMGKYFSSEEGTA